MIPSESMVMPIPNLINADTWPKARGFILGHLRALQSKMAAEKDVEDVEGEETARKVPPPSKGLPMEQALADLRLLKEGNSRPRQLPKEPALGSWNSGPRSETPQPPIQPSIQPPTEKPSEPLPAIPPSGGGPGLSEGNELADAEAKLREADKAYRADPHSPAKRQAYRAARKEVERLELQGRK